MNRTVFIKGNKAICFVLALIMMLGVFAFSFPQQAEAAGTSTSNATSITFGTKYKQSWTSTDNTKYYYKINVPEKGFVKVQFSDLYNANGLTVAVNFTILTPDGRPAFSKDAYETQAKSGTEYHTGLTAGTYYVTLSPVRKGAYSNMYINFKFTFEANKYCEAEPNNINKYASTMELDHMYQCYADMTDFGMQYRSDRHAFKLTNGVKYRLYFQNYDNLERDFGLWQLALYDASTDNTVSGYIIDKYGFDKQGKVSNGNTYFEFTCKKSGTYIWHTSGYRDEETPYQIGMYTHKTSITSTTIKLGKTSYTYDGKAKKPTVTVKKGSTTLKNGTDYTVTYASGRKNVGKYSVTIKGKGKYTGSKTLTFKINPKGTSISSVSAASKAFTVKWKKQATQTTGYQVQYSTSSKFSSPKTVTVSKNSTTSKKVTKLKAKKKYYVRVRTYKTVSGTKYYSGWSGAKTVTTKK